MHATLPRKAALAAWTAEARACLALSWPLVVTNTVEMGINITSTAMIGRIGPDALASATLGVAVYNLFLLFGIGVTAAVSPLVAGEIGRAGPASPLVRRHVQQGLFGAAALAIPVWILLWQAGPLLRALGQPPLLAAGAARYLHALQWSLLPTLAYLVLRSFLAAAGRPRWAVGVGLAALALNALLNWLLIGPHGAFPGLGLAGSGLATLGANTFMAASLGLLAVLDPRLRRVRVFAGLLRPDWRGFGAFWRLGLPIGLGLMLETGMFAVAAVVIGRVDAPALAAHAIALQVAALTFMVPLGIAQAATIRIGQAAGAGSPAAVVRAGWTALAIAVAATGLSAAVLIAAPGPIIGLFLGADEPGTAAVRAVAVTLLGLAGLFQIADGSQVVLGGMLRGLRDTRVPMLIAAVGYWGIGIPLGAALAFWFGLRAPGVWLGLSAGLFAAAVLLLGRWLKLIGGTGASTVAPRPSPGGT